MSIRRLLGFGFVGLAVLALGNDLVTSGMSGFTSLGDAWGTLNAPSLNLVQAVLQRYIHPAVWDPVLVTVLLLPAWLVLAVPGLLCLVDRPKSYGMDT